MAEVAESSALRALHAQNAALRQLVAIHDRLGALVLHFANGDEAVLEPHFETAADFLAGFAVQVDAGARRARLEKARQRLLSEVERGEKKLANPAFIAKAAADVVAHEHELDQPGRDQVGKQRPARDSEEALPGEARHPRQRDDVARHQRRRARQQQDRRGERAVVEYTVARRATIGPDARVGPFATLAPGANVPAGTVTGPHHEG